MRCSPVSHFEKDECAMPRRWDTSRSPSRLLPPVRRPAFAEKSHKGPGEHRSRLARFSCFALRGFSSPFKCRERLDESPKKGHTVHRESEDVLSRAFIECDEIAGKTVRSLKVYEDPSEDCEVVIEFTDGTTFSCSMEQKSSMKSVLFAAESALRRFCETTTRSLLFLHGITYFRKAIGRLAGEPA